MTELQFAIENLYTVFARYPKPNAIEFCPCGCTKPEEVAPFIRVPLRDLRREDLLNYAFSAITTQGSVNDFRYLLPRLFEAIVEDLGGINAEILFGKLSNKKSNWHTWPEVEIEAVRSYLLALWRTALASYPIQNAIPTIFEIETVLCCIAETGEPLERYLKLWTETQTIPANDNLIQFVTIWGEKFASGKTLDEAFWGDCPSQGAELRQWILRPDTVLRIQNSAHLLRGDGRDRFEPALVILRQEALRP